MNAIKKNSRVLDFQYFLLQLFLSGCLFFALTGGGLLIGWDTIARVRKLHSFLTAASAVVFFAAGFFFYFKDRRKFFELEPFRSIVQFFRLPPVASIGFLYLLFFATQLGYQLTLHFGLETGLWDLGFFDQVIWNTAKGDFLITSVRGGIHVFAEHFKPMLIVLAPLYWMADDTVFLLMVTALLTSSSLIGVYLIARRVTLSHASALVLALGVFFYKPMVMGINFLYHTQMLADPLLLFGFYFVVRKRLPWALVFFVLALMCKENIALDVLGIGLFFTARGEKKSGAVIALLALVWLTIFLFAIEPNFRCAYHFRDKWNIYQYLLHPQPEILKLLLKPNPIGFLAAIFGPFLFLSFAAKKWYWLLGPALLLRLLSAIPEMRMIKYHYTGGLDALVFISAVYGFAQWIGSAPASKCLRDSAVLRFLRNPKIVSGAVLLAALLFSGVPQLCKIDKMMRETTKPENQRVTAILRSIPPNYSVMTIQHLAPHLSHRSRLYVYCSMFEHTPYQEDSKNPDLVVFDKNKFQACDEYAFKDFVSRGYELLLASDSLEIYGRPGMAGEIPMELRERWEHYKKMPGISYRSILRAGYRNGLCGVLIIFLIVLLYRQWKISASPK